MKSSRMQRSRPLEPELLKMCRPLLKTCRTAPINSECHTVKFIISVSSVTMDEVENYLMNAKYPEGLSKGEKQTFNKKFETISSWRMAISTTNLNMPSDKLLK